MAFISIIMFMGLAILTFSTTNAMNSKDETDVKKKNTTEFEELMFLLKKIQNEEECFEVCDRTLVTLVMS